MDNSKTLKDRLIKELLKAIEENIEQINVSPEGEEEDYISMIRLQYISEEIENLENLIN